MQAIEFIGNLTGDPAQTEGEGWKVTRFSVAVDRKARKDGKKDTDFFRVNAWNKLGDNCLKYLAKGRKVYVRGELQARTYDNNDGKTVLSLDVNADSVEFLSPRQEQAEEPRPKAKEKYTEADFTDLQSDDIPF